MEVVSMEGEINYTMSLLQPKEISNLNAKWMPHVQYHLEGNDSSPSDVMSSGFKGGPPGIIKGSMSASEMSYTQ